MKTYEGKTALITGGSSGTGLALAKQLAESGAHVTILARDPVKLDSACQEVMAARLNDKQHIEAISVDIVDADQVKESLSSRDAPDYLFNVAGKAHPGLFKDIDIEIFHEIMDVNYFGNLNVTHTFLKKMIKRHSGHIINVSSIAGFHGIYGYGSYSPAKFALRGMSDVMRAELKPCNVRVSIVFPPDMDTPARAFEEPLKPEVLRTLEKFNTLIKPEVVARAILRDVAKGIYLITPGFDSTLYFHLHNLLGPLAYGAMDLMLSYSRSKVKPDAKDESCH